MRVGEEAAQRAGVEAPAARREEERLPRAACELRPRFAQVAADPVRPLLAEGDEPLLAALAEHADVLLLPVHVREVEADRLRAPEPGRIDELEERAVPKRERAVTVNAVQRSLDLGDPGPAPASPSSARAAAAAARPARRRARPRTRRRPARPPRRAASPACAASRGTPRRRTGTRAASPRPAPATPGSARPRPVRPWKAVR